MTADKLFTRRDTLMRHLKNLYLKTLDVLATGTVVQKNVRRFRLDDFGVYFCTRCLALSYVSCGGRLCQRKNCLRASTTPLWRGSVGARATRTANAVEAQASQI